MDATETSVDAELVRDENDPRPPSRAGAVQRFVLIYLALVAVMAAIGFLGRLFVFDSAIGEAEADFMSWIADNRVGWLDSVATTGSTFSDTWTVIGVMVGAITMLWAAGHGRHAALVLFAVGLEFGTFLLVGALVDRARPTVESLNSVPSTPSFPSGHVAAAFVLYGTLVICARSLNPRVPGWVWVFPIVLALLVAFSRLYEGVHYPFDVLGGYLLGVLALFGAALATGLLDPDVERRLPWRR